jgi:hypothetical protein
VKAGDGLVAKLAKLADLNSAGVLTDPELVKAKARLLRSDGGSDSALV